MPTIWITKKPLTSNPKMPDGESGSGSPEPANSNDPETCSGASLEQTPTEATEVVKSGEVPAKEQGVRSDLPGCLLPEDDPEDASDARVELTEDNIAADFASQYADSLRFDH